MSREAILKISSSEGRGLGTGFVIDQNNDGIFIATCGHVVKTCGSEYILVDGKKANVINNYYDEGLDIAILYLPNIQIVPLSVVYDTTSDKVEVEGFTYFLKDIKKETMINIGAKYKVEIEKKNRKVEIVRLTSTEKITSGYSGSPVISKITGDVVGMVIVEAREQYTNYAISSKHILDIYNFPKNKRKKKKIRFLSLDEWLKIIGIVGVIITFLAWIFPSPLNYFKDNNIFEKSISNKIIYSYWGQVTKSNIGLKKIEITDENGILLAITDGNGNFDFNNTKEDILLKYKIGGIWKSFSSIAGEKNELE